MIWIAAGVVLLLFYFIFDPLENRWMPQCIFYKITGLQCMGCGSQRMLHSLLHGDLKGAMEANLFLFFSLPFIVFLIFVELSRTRYPGLYKKVHSLGVIITATAMLVAWLFVRNILGI